MPPPRSVIWNYFDTWLQDDSKLGRCNACDKTIKCGAGSTSGLKQHLRTHHLEMYWEYCRFRDEGKLARDLENASKKDSRVFEPQYANNEDPKNGHVLLSGNDFSNDTMNAFKGLLEDEHFTNVTLVTDGNKQIKAHKVILSAFSPFFKEILVNNPHQHPLVYLRGVKHEYLQSMVDFVYLGQTKIKFEEVTEFIKVASDLQIKGLCSPQNLQNDSKKEKVDDSYRPVPSELETQTEMEDKENCIKEEDNNLAIKQEAPDFLVDRTNSNLATSSEVMDPIDNLEVVMDDSYLNTTEIAMDDSYLNTSISEPPVQRFPCEFPGCRYIAAQKRYLREHRQAIHEGIKYACDTCDHKATTKSNLKKHKQLKHEVDKFPCHQCEYAANSIGELTQHLGFCQVQSIQSNNDM